MNASTHQLKSVDPGTDTWQLKVDLAACFRMIADLGWHESVANHFSAAASDDGKKFIMNPKWVHFSLIKASDIQLFNSNDSETMNRNDAPDQSAWCIHSRIHAAIPQAKALLHCHPPYASAVSCLKDPRILPIDQSTAKFFDRIAIDLGFEGMADNEAEGDRIAAVLGDYNCIMMGNHGVTVIGNTIAEAFEDLYYLERACRNLVLAYQTGQPLNIMSDIVAERTAQGWDSVRGAAQRHFDQYKSLLDRQDPSYAE